MTERIHALQVGAPDPELRNSPIVAAQALAEEPLCYFNGHAYRHDQFVCSGSELLRCARGVWLQEGTCDPDNP